MHQKRGQLTWLHALWLRLYRGSRTERPDLLERPSLLPSAQPGASFCTGNTRACRVHQSALQHPGSCDHSAQQRSTY